MNTILKIEDVFIQIRDKLQKDGVKLWLPPYYNENNGPSEGNLKILANQYCQSLHLDCDSTYAAISELQTNAIEKLKQRDRFKECGLASVKIKVLNTQPKLFTKEILLSLTGADLKKIISNDIDLPAERFKLIANGVIIKDKELLSQQGVRNGNQILVITLNESISNMMESENRFRDLEATKADTSLLASDTSYMHLEDQHGNIINIPPKEKKSLLVAMALHEKGRTALKREDYARALVFFLDADKEFSQINSQLLDSVDNYALLDLDIAWCYLCLQSFVHLPEAYQRLKRCEEMFHKSYGQNLERLIAVKGSPGNEAALFMRLHLLQAIVLYHQNQRQEALELLRKSESELSLLKVDENKLLTLVELGYSLAESRLGLRATHGDINLAANYINENRANRIESRRKAMAELILQKEKQKLGKCIDGKQYVDPKFLNMLVKMGYSKASARIALQQCNNIISDSIQYIQEHPEPGPSNTKSQEFLSFIDDLIPELIAAGFEEQMAKLALKKHSGDIMKAAEELLLNNGVIEGNLEEMLEDIGKKIESPEEKEERLKKEEAWGRLSQDISMVDDDHLDLTLEKEEMFLNQYMELLK